MQPSSRRAWSAANDVAAMPPFVVVHAAHKGAALGPGVGKGGVIVCATTA